jgi:formylglycine-generating enzyme required for sulfatase activity
VTLRPFLDEFQTHFDRLLLWYLRPRGAAGPNTEAEGKDERKNLDQQGVLVVFIDDLDRCLPNKAVQTLEAIKLIIGQPGVVFVLGASEEAVKAAIRTHFEAIKYIEAGGDSQQYLEKLIQVPFALPRPEEHDLGLYIENLLAQNPDKATVKTLQATLPLIVKGVPTNPRRLKTFLNTVELEWGFLVNAEQKGSLSKDALARWLAICAAEPRFAATVAQLPRASQLPFVLDAQRLMRGEKLEDESKARQYDNWSRDTCPRLWQLLAHAQLSFNMTPADFGTLISLRAPIVQAVEPDRAPAKPADVEPLAPRSGRAQRVGPGGDWPAWLPPLLRVPKGEFLMGSDKAIDSLARDNEMPQHREAIALPYLIGQFPVTNADFMRFAEANKTFKTAAEAPKHPGGYVWTGSEWKQVKGANWQRPQGGTSTIAERMDHPVVHVNWRDALAYCQWLNEMLASLMKDKADSLPEALAKLLAESQATHLMARLPTEAEWEKAARGDDGRLWPWGNQFDEKKCNTAEGGKGGTTPVGAYSQAGGDSPYGCADVAGNVWEWCSTKWRENYKAKADDTLEGDSSRVLRGGSFFNNRDYARCAYRSWYVPDFVFNSIGFRVVVAPGQ